MYTEQLKEIVVPIDDLFLDPNNPRFWSEKTGRDVPDKKIADDNHQASTLKEITTHGVEELLTSILRNGFLPLDRIVVREISGVPGKYVVVEGNRRLAALKTLRQRISDGILDEDGVSEDHLERIVETTENIQVLLYQGGEGEEIAWMLQGIRHISGIRSWSPAQQGKLVADQIDKHGMKFREAGQSLGLPAVQVGKRYRAYKALEQMRADPEFKSKAKNEYYSLFEEALGSATVKNWLDWKEQTYSFGNEKNLRQFYSWITPDEENGDKRRLHDPRHIKNLGALIAGNHTALLDQVDSHLTPIATAYEKSKETGPHHNWKESIENAILLLKEIPQSAISSAPADVLSALAVLAKEIESIKSMAASVSQDQKI